MNSFDVDALMAVKNSFQGNKFQWVKTDDLTKLGKVVSVVEVEPGRGNRFIAILSDGTKIDTDSLTNKLLMLMDDQPALSMAEVKSINYVPSVSEGINVSPDIPNEFKADVANIVQSLPATKTPVKPEVRVQALADPGDLFGMFSVEETDLNLALSVKLPSRSLLKMMYSNSQDKDQFLSRLSAYINNSVTPEAIAESLKKTLGQDKKKKLDATEA